MTDSTIDALLTQLKPFYKKAPWIWLVGNQHTGKSTLLKNADLDLQLIIETDTFSLWKNKQAVFIELELPTDQLDTLKQRLFKAYPEPFDCLLFAVDVAKFLENNLLQALQHTITWCDAMLNRCKANVPAHLLLTQADRIDGFSAFFADIDKQQREQPLAITCSPKLTQNYQTFIHSLNKKLLQRVHREQTQNKRSQLQTLPLQLAKLEPGIQQLLNRLNQYKKLQLEQIYFISATRQGQIFNFITQQPVDDGTQINKVFFVKGTLEQVTRVAQAHYKKPKKPVPRLVSALLALAIILSALGTWHHVYERSRQALVQARQYLAIQPNQTGTLPWLQRLNALQNAVETLQPYHASWYKFTGLAQANQLYEQAQSAYEKLLQKAMQPYLLNLLFNSMTSHLRNDRFSLYNSLKTYLMLLQPERRSNPYIDYWFSQVFQAQYPDNTDLQQQLLSHLNYLLDSKQFTWTKNPKLIQQARKNLWKAGTPTLVWFALINQYPHKKQALFNHTDLSYLDLTGLELPEPFTSDNFKKIFSSDIPLQVQQITQGNWILGTPEKTVAQSQQLQLIAQTQQIYLHEYSLAWLGLIDHIRLKNPTSITDAQNLTLLLLDKKSPLYQLLNIIMGNIELNKNPKDGYLRNKTYLAAKQLLAHQDTQQQAMLIQFKQYLESIQGADDINKASFEASAKRFTQNKSPNPLTQLFAYQASLPTPLRQWFDTIANGSWTLLLDNAQSYLNSIWTTLVLPEYNQHINNRYPLFNSKQDITLASFTHFFGPGGTIDNFFNYYLQPFVNMQSNYWTWQQVDGQTIPVSQSILDMFIRASLIQQMFYTDNKEQIGFRFSLIPQSLGPNVQSFALNLNSQMIDFTASTQQASVLSWPGPGTGVAAHFNTTDTSNPTLSFDGPWAWFRLLDQSIVTPTDDPALFNVTFKINNDTATYRLNADNRVNPFLPGILQKFRLPKQL